MYLLAFESSCDDTSVALLHDEELISMHTHTQVEHIKTLWVVPEIAARLHADHIFELITKVLNDAGITLEEIDIFAATSEPGLVPSLLIGKTVAKTLATTHKKPLIWVNHIEGHIFSVLLERKITDIEFPSVVLSASGGHNDLFFWKSLYEIERVGSTRDDSAGESMDKVGRSMGLPFPAGRHIDELAGKFDSNKHSIVNFPLVLPTDCLDFSFSWLKSAALREIEIRKKDHEEITETDRIEIAYSYQKIITDILIARTLEAQKKLWAKSICIVGGVSANSALRKAIGQYSEESQIPYYLPKSMKYCGDNAAMIGIRAYYQNLKQKNG
jgi:N6-L-threonylcarbamoyladenine synthase